ncbi:hypothetical protein E3U55_06095 [Filobacillus milosensis]|uniref:NERD domain-containing protein n=1 Tax=Filobacillus milosensis TaxID=94137 RepID=A0A4Y8IMY7_9BACI|nr:nuclease-related domain-containing protein [Filobacillus milosensis]TFB22805.1 hypothetical protein E3U55_06095 [Filobacillus milosensis]
MIIKSREIPITLLQLASLKQRIESTHLQFQTIIDDHVIYQSGYRGELAFDYYLKAIDGEKICLLHSLRIVGPNAFQMDTLILTPSFFLIVEVKNFTGTIEFDHEFGQMTQYSNGRTRSFKDPISQVDNQTFHLQNWLMQQGIAAVPIESLVVFVSNHVHLTRKGDQEVDKRIIRAGKFIEKYQELKGKHSAPILTHQQLVNLAHMLKNRHAPLHIDVFKKYNLTLNDIGPGAPCLNCSYIPMDRIYGRWLCPKCQTISRDAHLYALKDFQLLVKDHISNREARWMLQVDDILLVSKLLKKSGLPFTGYKKDRVYNLNFDFQKDYAHLMKSR